MRGTKALTVFTFDILSLLIFQFQTLNVKSAELKSKIIFLMIGLQESISGLKTDGLRIHLVSFKKVNEHNISRHQHVTSRNASQ